METRHRMPTFIIFKNGKKVTSIEGANPKKLTDTVTEVIRNQGNNGGPGAKEDAGDNGEGPSESTGSDNWVGTSIPKGHQDITEQIEIKGIDLLNRDGDFGTGRALFAPEAPTGLAAFNSGEAKGKGKEKESNAEVDWVESDTDEQLIVFMPFQSSIKLQSLQITSLPLPDSDGDETPMRPKTIKLFTNRAQIMDFEEADDVNPTQTCVISPEDWDAKTGTATVELRYVKFQRISSLVAYFVDGDGDGEKLRIDRIRLVGDAGEKRDMGKLQKIGDLGGE